MHLEQTCNVLVYGLLFRSFLACVAGSTCLVPEDCGVFIGGERRDKGMVSLWRVRVF